MIANLEKETKDLKDDSNISIVNQCERDIAHIGLFLPLLAWKLTLLHEFQGQFLIDLRQLLLRDKSERMTVKALTITDSEELETFTQPRAL